MQDHLLLREQAICLGNGPPLRSLQRKTEDWDPTIVQINVADANIVDRCESCHMGIREPLKLTTASMTPKAAKHPDEYAALLIGFLDTALAEKAASATAHQPLTRPTAKEDYPR